MVRYALQDNESVVECVNYTGFDLFTNEKSEITVLRHNLFACFVCIVKETVISVENSVFFSPLSGAAEFERAIVSNTVLSISLFSVNRMSN